MDRSAARTPRARQKLLQAVVLFSELHENREAAVAAWDVAEDACGSARALRAESAQARRHSQTLLREAASMAARTERLVAEARTGSAPDYTETTDSG